MVRPPPLRALRALLAPGVRGGRPRAEHPRARRLQIDAPCRVHARRHSAWGRRDTGGDAGYGGRDLPPIQQAGFHVDQVVRTKYHRVNLLSGMPICERRTRLNGSFESREGSLTIPSGCVPQGTSDGSIHIFNLLVFCADDTTPLHSPGVQS